MHNGANELALRTHIRELLLEYAYTHLTVDHVQHSDTIVSEILAKILKPIPTHGPGELALPVDPFETLKTRLKFDALQPYDEVWRPSFEAFQLVKETYTLSNGISKTQSVWEEEDEFDYENMPHRPMSPPVLSRSSRRKTPSLGKNGRNVTKKTSLAASLSSHAIQPAAVTNLPEEKTLRLEDCLDLKLTIDASMHSDMLEFQRQVPFLCRPVPRSLPVHAADFLRSHSPDYEVRFTPISPPIFSREQHVRPSRTHHDSILGPIKLPPAEVPEMDQDIATESMKVIDGWATFPSGASTPSLSSGTSEVDELDEDAEFWRPSSAGVAPTIETLEVAKMDEPIFARADRPRTGRIGKKDGNSTSLSSFLNAHRPIKPFVRFSTDPSSDDVLPKRDHSPRSVSVVSLSMLGQPPSESDASTKTLSDPADETLDKDIRRVLKVHGASKGPKSYLDVIMDEPLDEKETMFMEVPKLPPPNEYLRSASKQTLRGHPSAVSGPIPGRDSSRPKISLPTNIKKATGLKSLNLELSWRPFSFGSRIPTHAELVGVDSLFYPKDEFLDDEEIPSQESIEEYLANFPFSVELEDNCSASDLHRLQEDGLGYDPHILKDIQSDNDNDQLDPRFNPNRDFDEDTLLLSRIDRCGTVLLPAHKLLQHTSANDLPASTDSRSYETSEYFSPVTAEFDSRFSLTQNADDANAYADSFAYAPTRQILHDQFNNDYSGHEEHKEMDGSRDKKKRRLNSAELDALCAMETMSQSMPAMPTTIDPKELMLPQTDNEPDTLDPSFADPTTLSAYNSQTNFLPSQSQSLSLYEDNASQEFNPVTVANTTLDSADDDAEPYQLQNHMPPSFDYFDGVYRDDHTLGPQRDVPFATRPSRPITNQLESTSQYGATLPLRMHQTEAAPSIGRTVNQANLDQLDAISGLEPVVPQCYATEVSKKQHLDLISSSALLSENDKLSAFLLLRGRKNIPDTRPVSPGLEELSQNGDAQYDANKAVPDQVLPVVQTAPPDLLSDTRAFSIPEPWQPPAAPHTYLVSINFVQQRALVQALESPRYAVRLVERDVVTPLSPTCVSPSEAPQVYSTDISIIVGPDSGVVFFHLSALPSQIAYKTLLDALAAHSWRFSNILLVLIAFPRSQLVRATAINKGAFDGPSSYSPPALKAVRRVRRDLALREGTGEKRASCAIELALADNVEQVAMFVRAFGDLSLRDSVVDFTTYIDEEEQEGERDLAELEGMNAFCAAAILRCCTLEEFLEMPSEQRSEGLADVIGKERIEHVNSILSSRMQAMDMDVPSSSEFMPSANE